MHTAWATRPTASARTTAVTPRLVELLSELRVLLKRPDPRWSESMRRFEQRARDAAQGGSEDDARGLLTDILGVYAGMGSFPDLVLQDRNGVLPEQHEVELDGESGPVRSVTRSPYAALREVVGWDEAALLQRRATQAWDGGTGPWVSALTGAVDPPGS